MLSSGSTGVPKAARLTHAGLADFAASSRRILDVPPGRHHGELAAGRPQRRLPAVPPARGLRRLHQRPRTHRAGARRPAALARPPRTSTGPEHSWAPTFAYRLVADALADRPDAPLGPGPASSPWCAGASRSRCRCCGASWTATAPFGVREEHLVPAVGHGRDGHGRHLRPARPARDRAPPAQEQPGRRPGPGRRGRPDAGLRHLRRGPAPPAHGVALRVVDDRRRSSPAGRIGRLQVRSARRLTPGYVNNPEADARGLPRRAGTGWTRATWPSSTAGRSSSPAGRKDLIILNGHNVYCHEVEEAAAAVARASAQGETAACGMPDPSGAPERALAVFFVSRGAADGRTDRARRCRRRCSPGSASPPRTWCRSPAAEFPRTPAGKVRRAELRGPPARR